MRRELTSRPLRATKRRANLADLEERLELFVDNVKDYAIFMLDTEGRAVTWNAGVQRVLGYPEDEFLGLAFHRLFRASDQSAAREELSRAAQDGRSEDERWHVRRDGTAFWVSGVLTALRDPHGGLRGFAKVMRDTTAQKQAHAEREELLRREQEARAQAERTNRVKDEFLATVSHELRTPLNAILGWTRMLSNGQLDSERSTRAIQIVQRNADTLMHLVEDLLDTSRAIAGTLELNIHPVSLRDVVDAALESADHQANEKQIQISVSGSDDRLLTAGDPRRLQQVVSSLLSNAIKFTPSSGSVAVDLERRDEAIEVIVRDTGQGIPEADLPHIFDRFHHATAAQRSTSGLGLGLAIAREIVEAHHGTIAAQSEGAGQGTTFTIRLPMTPGLLSVQERRPALASRVEAECPPHLVGLQALVVEDRSEARELVQLILERCGMRVVAVDSCRAALTALAEQPIDVIVSDIGLTGPDDGLTLIRAVREREAERGGLTPAIAVTAYGGPDDRLRALTAGYQIHMTKPVEPARLIAAVAAVVQICS